MQSQQSSESSAPHDWWTAGALTRRLTQVSIPLPTSGARSYPRSTVLPAFFVLCGAAITVASTLPWMSANLREKMSTVAGTNHVIATAVGIDGWLTFCGGVAIMLLGALMIVSGEGALRILSLLIAFATAGFSVYAVVRILQKIHDAHSTASGLGALRAGLAGHVHIGYGLVIVSGAAGAAVVAAALESAAKRRAR